MAGYAVGFIFIMSFTVMVGVGAIIFISFDAKASENPNVSTQTTTQRLYKIVRRVNTETIETVDATGSIQQWTRTG